DDQAPEDGLRPEPQPPHDRERPVVARIQADGHAPHATVLEEVAHEPLQCTRHQALTLVILGYQVANLGGPAGPAPIVQPEKTDGSALVAQLPAPAVTGTEALQLLGDELSDALLGCLGGPRDPPRPLGPVALREPVDAVGVMPLRQPHGQVVVQL